jgi:tetratricopeptide (TPR) repeat protein
MRTRTGSTRTATASTGSVLAFVLCVLVPGLAGAQPAEPQGEPDPETPTQAADSPAVTEAKRHYAQGVVFFRGERYEQAIAEFTEAWSLWENPTILYGLAQANERLLRVPRAIDFYRRYLDRAPADASNRQEVEDTIRGLTSLLADVTFESNVPAKVFTNDEEIGESPGTIQLATGRYEIELRAEGYETERQSLQIAARSHRTLQFTLRRAAPRQVVVHEQTGLPPVWFWAGSGLTVAAGVAAIVLGVLTMDAADAFQSDPLPSTRQRADGQRLAIATDIALGSTVLFGAGTFILFLNTNWGDSPASAPDASE